MMFLKCAIKSSCGGSVWVGTDLFLSVSDLKEHLSMSGICCRLSLDSVEIVNKHSRIKYSGSKFMELFF